MRLCTILLASVFVAGCGGTPTSEMPPAKEPRPTLGAPITAPMNTWTWVDFPDSTCDEGTPTGIGINPGTSGNVLFFLMGGGACWDYSTCITVGFAAHGPFQKRDFDGSYRGFSGILDRNDPDNPARDWSYVFVPYCTGDVHAGDNEVVYSSGNDSQTYRHRGRRNLEAFMKRVAGTFPDAPKVVISGSSAGGYGAAFGFPTARRYFPDAKVYLVDDSGPPLIGDAIPASFRAAWFKNWNLGPVLDATCPGCRDDLSLVIPSYAPRYPDDRMALLSSLQDKTISGYLLRAPATFENDLLEMATERLDPTAHGRYFFVPGQTHTMLFDLAQFTSNGVRLGDWLKQLVSDDPAWKSTKPKTE